MSTYASSGYLLQVSESATFPETPCPPPRPIKNRLERCTAGPLSSFLHNLSSVTTVRDCPPSPQKSSDHSKAFKPILRLGTETATSSREGAKTPPSKSNIGLNGMFTPKTESSEDDGRSRIRVKPTPGMTPEQRKAAWAFGMTYQANGDGTPFTLATLLRSYSIIGDSHRQRFSCSPSDTRRFDSPLGRSKIRNIQSSKFTGKFCTPSRPRNTLPSPYMTEAQMRVEARRQKKMKQRAEEDLGIFGLRLALQGLSLQVPDKPRCSSSGARKRNIRS